MAGQDAHIQKRKTNLALKDRPAAGQVHSLELTRSIPGAQKFTRIGESTRAPSRGILEREHDRDSLKHLMLCRASRWTHQGTRFRGCSVNLSVKPHVHNLPHPSNLPPFTASVLRAYHSLPLPFPSIRDLFDLARWLHRLLLVSHNFGARPAMCTRIGWDGPVKSFLR